MTGASVEGWPRLIRTVVAVWLAAHAAMALTSLPATPAPQASVAALVLLVAVSAATVGRVTDGPPLTRGSAALVGGAAVVVGTLVTPFLEGQAVFGYANWWPGAVAPLLVCLVWCGHPGTAGVTAVGGCLVVTLAAIRSSGGAPMDWIATVLMCGPLALAVLGTLAIHGVLVRANRAVAEYSDDESESYLRTAQATAREHVAAVRHRQVEAAAVPVLMELSRPSSDMRALVARCAVAEQTLRDALAAPDVLDGRTRAHVADARSRGVRVTVRDERAWGTGPGLTRTARGLISEVLPQLPVGSEVTVRLAPAGDAMTFVAAGASSDAAASAERAARREGPDSSDVVVDHEEDGILFVRVSSARRATVRPSPTGDHTGIQP